MQALRVHIVGIVMVLERIVVMTSYIIRTFAYFDWNRSSKI